MNVSKSNMLENHLIIGQWYGPLTGTRETTSNENGPQGTKIQLVNVKNEAEVEHLWNHLIEGQWWKHVFECEEISIKACRL